MFRKPAKSITAVLVVSLVLLSVPREVLAQSSAANQTRRSATSSTKRIVWSLIGAGIGFGAGLLFGVHKFDDAINSDRKVWISALGGAAAGGIAGGILSWNVKPDVAEPRTPKRNDPLWEGMAAGAVAGAVVGLIVVPNRECKPENPECPTVLRIGVGIPVIAAGAALGALVDRLRQR